MPEAGTPPNPRYTMQLATQPSESYVEESPVSSNGDLVAARQRDGSIALASVGETGKLNLITRSPDSDTRWKVQTLLKTGLKIKKIQSLVLAQTADTGGGPDRVLRF